MSGCAGYLGRTHDPKDRKEYANKAVRRLKYLQKTKGLEFDAIAVRGLSGMLLGTTVSDRLGIPLVVVRKRESQHSDHMCEGPYYPNDDGGPQDYLRYIILDDCVSTGETLLAIEDEVQEEYHKPVCVGVYLYRNNAYSEHEEGTETKKRLGSLNP